MKKRAMKKYIPKNTLYCYNSKTRKVCKWWRHLKTIVHTQENCEYYEQCESQNKCTSCRTKVIKCMYLNYTDYDEESLLWDMCKECNISTWKG